VARFKLFFPNAETSFELIILVVVVMEPFIVPSLYEKYVNSSQNIAVVDEWTLSLAMGSDSASEMENHYKTFITEEDFSETAGPGLNWVRIPIGFWAIEAINDEPFLVGHLGHISLKR